MFQFCQGIGFLLFAFFFFMCVCVQLLWILFMTSLSFRIGHVTRCCGVVCLLPFPPTEHRHTITLCTSSHISMELYKDFVHPTKYNMPFAAWYKRITSKIHYDVCLWFCNNIFPPMCIIIIIIVYTWNDCCIRWHFRRVETLSMHFKVVASTQSNQRIIWFLYSCSMLNIWTFDGVLPGFQMQSSSKYFMNF